MNVIYLGQAVPFDDLKIISHIRSAEYFLTTFTTGISEKALSDYLGKMSITFPDQTIFYTGYQIAKISDNISPNLVKLESVNHFKDIIRQI
jgi:MerR family transcriptional regulator, light-induced transcriptional regulator